MDREEITNSQQPCSICGESRVILKDGFLYCVECGTRAADSQPILEFSDDVYMCNKATRKRKVKNIEENYGKIWSTWHGHNMILAGLASELGSCCSREYELKKTVLKLWGMFLGMHQMAFYTKTSKPAPPKLIYKFHKKDLEYLYDMKKPRKKRNTNANGLDETMDRIEVFRAMNRKKHQLIAKHYKKISSSQKSNIPTSQTLADLKITEETKPTVVNFNEMNKKHFKKYMTGKEIKDHMENGFCGFDCKCLFKKQHNLNLYNRVNYLSIFNLYAILALALLINNDEVHVGDMLRWCREGHLSLGRYNHFFPEDMVFKSSDPHFTVTPNAMIHKRIRRVAGMFAKKFNLDLIKAPNMKILIHRYLKELELPNNLSDFVMRLMEINECVSDFTPKASYSLPNYEAMALSYIIIALKMIFGLDGVTENKISGQTEEINQILQLNKIKKNLNVNDFENKETEGDSLRRLFVWQSWMNYIEYRKICIGQYHYPTKMRLDPDDCDNPDLFLHHKKTMRRDEDVEQVVKNQAFELIRTIMKDVDYNYDDTEKTFPVFSCSINPMSSYVEHLLLWANPNDSTFNRSIIEEDFTSYDLSFVFNSLNLQKHLSKNNVHLQVISRRAVHTNVKHKNYFLRHMDNHVSLKSNRDVHVINCDSSQWENEKLREKITNIVLDTDNNAAPKYILLNVSKRKRKNIQRKNAVKSRCVQLNLCYEDFWIQHYSYLNKFKKEEFEAELDSNFSSSFAWLLRECAGMAEMSTLELYTELYIIEKSLIQKLQSRK